MNEKELIQVAKIGKSVGLKGYVKLHNLSDFLYQFKKDTSFYLNKNKQVKIKDFNPKNNSVLFYDFEDIDLSKKLVNSYLYQSIEQTRKTCVLNKDEFFYFDVLDCDIFIDDLLLGKVVSIVDNCLNYLFEIQTSFELVEKKYPKVFYVPYVDKYIINIDISAKSIFCKKEVFYILENS